MRRLYSVFFMFFLTFVCAAAVTGVKEMNRERIDANRRARFQRVILDVLDVPVPSGATLIERERIFSNRVTREPREGKVFFVSRNDDGQVTGRAFALTGPGFWGPISAMIGLTPSGDRVIDVDFFEHRETPGLGARMTEDWFRRQFRGLPVDRAGTAPFFRLTPVAPNKSRKELDAITGATRTSRAVETMLNAGLRETHFPTDRDPEHGG